MKKKKKKEEEEEEEVCLFVDWLLSVPATG